MFPVIEDELKTRIRIKSSVREIAVKIGMPYGTLAAKLNGFSPLTDEECRAIEKKLKEISGRG